MKINTSVESLLRVDSWSHAKRAAGGVVVEVTTKRRKMRKQQ